MAGKRYRCVRALSNTSLVFAVRVNNPVRQSEEDVKKTTSTVAVPAMAEEEEGGEEEGEQGKEELEEEGQGMDEEEVFEESPEEEVQVVEWPAGVPQASAKDLDKLSQVEEVRKH